MAAPNGDYVEQSCLCEHWHACVLPSAVSKLPSVAPPAVRAAIGADRATRLIIRCNAFVGQPTKHGNRARTSRTRAGRPDAERPRAVIAPTVRL